MPLFRFLTAPFHSFSIILGHSPVHVQNGLGAPIKLSLTPASHTAAPVIVRPFVAMIPSIFISFENSPPPT